MRAQLTQVVVVILMCLAGGILWAQEQEIIVPSAAPPQETVRGAAVYEMTKVANWKLNIQKVSIPAHHNVEKKKAGWKGVYLGQTRPFLYVLLEEIPAGSPSVIGAVHTGEITILAVKGEGYTEVRSSQGKLDKRINWRAGDLFAVPYGSWVGHANLSPEECRLLTIRVSTIAFSEEMENPFMAGKLLAVPPDDGAEAKDNVVTMDPTEVQRVKKGIAPPPHMRTERRGWEGFKPLFYVGTPGDIVNLRDDEAPLFHLAKRAADGWRAFHVDPGLKLVRYLLHEIPPNSKEIGHKHGGGLLFYVLKGKGYMAYRAEDTDVGPLQRVDWEEGDLYLMPWLTKTGTWHSRRNPFTDVARNVAFDITMDDEILDPTSGTRMRYLNERSDRDKEFKPVF